MVGEIRPCPWEPIEGFDGWREYWGFERWMQDQILDGRAEEVPVLHLYSGADFPEKWFRHKPSSEVWRLVEPDPPFGGVFLRVGEL
jgi:hypothetical protein